jgi:hypothetical protein
MIFFSGDYSSKNIVATLHLFREAFAPAPMRFGIANDINRREKKTVTISLTVLSEIKLEF